MFSQVLYSTKDGYTYSKNEYVVHKVFEAKNRKAANIEQEKFDYPILNLELVNSLNKRGYSINLNDNPTLDLEDMLALTATVNVQVIAEYLFPAIVAYYETCKDSDLVLIVKEKLHYISSNTNYILVAESPDDFPKLLRSQ
ncbi:hypothetical protein KO527_11660 [Pseudoalteromonas sp. C2R02]|uniref:hypothetical protein n=1 Tax=Pseudoalteromonas sp. C2R02 TaxID=2841565 RepID=UPI001C08D8C7|nr:hypothetical protein [Pseudoalteromonas sp. C2R02]MBU2970007.1 hypothetical protein [Pseudoalteromonas sp. C2R02]